MVANLFELAERLEHQAPEYLALATASTADEFDAALIPLLAKAVDHLESNSKNYRRLDETGLTGVFTTSLNGFGLLATQETNSNGHVDVTITGYLCRPQQRRLGEAKLYDGYVYHLGGLKQLLGYMTGRASGYLLTYVRKKNVAALIKGLRVQMDKKRPLRQTGTCADHDLRWSFSSLHNHSSGEQVKVSHIGVNIFAD